MEAESDISQHIHHRDLIDARVEGETSFLQHQSGKSKWFTSVAFVIQSKVEFHDAFLLILTAIYESLRDTKKQPNHIVKNIKPKSEADANNIPEIHDLMAYAELVAHIAFLRTIPAPVFNSEVNILFMDTKINLKENHFQ